MLDPPLRHYSNYRSACEELKRIGIYDTVENLMSLGITLVAKCGRDKRELMLELEALQMEGLLYSETLTTMAESHALQIYSSFMQMVQSDFYVLIRRHDFKNKLVRVLVYTDQELIIEVEGEE